MAKTETLLAELESSCEMTDDLMTQRFLDAIAGLQNRRSDKVLRRMLRCFRDTDAGEVQYELVEACEAYPNEQYVPILAQEYIAIAEKSSQWLRLLFQSILNSRETAELLVQECETLPLITLSAIIESLVSLTTENQKYRSVLRQLQLVASTRFPRTS